MPSVLSKLREEFSFIRGNLLVLIISYMMFRISGGLIGSFSSLYYRGLGASPFLLGVIGSVGSLVLAIVRIPGAYVADRYGRKNIIAIFTYATSLCFLIYALAPDWRFILLAVVIQNLCNVYYPALDAIEADSIPLKRRGTGYAATQILPHLTVLGAPLVSGYLVETMGLVPGLRVSYVLAAVGGLASAVTRTFFLKETLENPERMESGDLLGVFRQSFRSIVEIWRMMPPDAMYLNVLLLLFSFERPIFINFHALYANDVVGVQGFQWSLLATVSMTTGLIFGIPLGRLIDHVGKKRGILLSFLFSTPVTLFMIFSQGFAQHLVVIVLYAVSGAFYPAYSALQADMIPREMRGRVIGIVGTLRILATIPSAALAGLLYEYHPAAPFVLTIALELLSISIVVFRIREPSRPEV